MPCCFNNKGFTFPELMVSVAIIFTVFAFAGVNLLNIIPDASLKEASDTLRADCSFQQNAAMMGESDQSSQIDYSVQINSESYILYKGRVFSATDPSNYQVKLPQNVTISTNFPNSKITFAAMTGEIRDFDPNANQITLYGVNGHSMVIRFNKLGNVFYVNKI